MSKRTIDIDVSQNKRAAVAARSKDNEVFSSVLLSCDGSKREIKTSINDLENYLGGPWNYLGGWDDISTMMVRNVSWL